MERPGGAEPEDRGTPGAHDPQPAAPPGPSGPSGPSDPPGPPDPPGPGSAGEALSALGSFGRRLLVLVPVYLAGALGLSLGFVVFGLALYLGWRRVRGGKERSLRAARRLLDDEERITAQTLHLSHRELPAWVSFPDVEKVEWLNKIVAQIWPFLGQYMEKMLAETVAPIVRASNPHLQTFTFTRVELGEKPLRILGVKVHTGQSKNQILLDLNISYVGDLQIDVEVKKYFCKAGVKGMQLHGVLRLILEPLLGDLPIVGAVSMFFIRRPMLDINWTGMTNLLDIPGLSALSDSMIMDSIAAFLVLPNRLLVPLVPDLQEVAQLRSPLPRGIVRVHLLAARALGSKDTFVRGLIEGKSDPYALVRVGTQVFCSRVVDNDLNPQWGETYEVMVHEVPGQELEVEVFDKDPDKDDFLGVGDVGTECSSDMEMRGGGEGMEWGNGRRIREDLVEGMEKRGEWRSASWEGGGSRRVTCHPLHCPPRQATYNTNSPVWEEAFRFFLQDPNSQDLDIQVKDDTRQLALGSLTLPLSRLLSAPDLTLDQWFQLSSSGPASRLYMKLVMRVWGGRSLGKGSEGTPEKRVGRTWRGAALGGGSSQPHPEVGGVGCGGGVRSGEQARSPPPTDLPLPTSPPEAPAGQLGQVKLTVWYYTEEQKLVSLVHSCRALRQSGRDTPDPYVSLLLLPDKNRASKRKTSPKKKTLSPEFNERFEWDMSLDEAMRRKLEVSVKSNVSFMTRERELLGKVRGRGPGLPTPLSEGHQPSLASPSTTLPATAPFLLLLLPLLLFLLQFSGTT
uniref:Extended synaptotagmin 1 n=1 Tax=Ornithorhynchus anatinus TaxID=9258 RepID=A0A6I8P0G6_ORNAN